MFAKILRYLVHPFVASYARSLEEAGKESKGLHSQLQTQPAQGFTITRNQNLRTRKQISALCWRSSGISGGVCFTSTGAGKASGGTGGASHRGGGGARGAGVGRASGGAGGASNRGGRGARAHRGPAAGSTGGASCGGARGAGAGTASGGTSGASRRGGGGARGICCSGAGGAAPTMRGSTGAIRRSGASDGAMTGPAEANGAAGEAAGSVEEPDASASAGVDAETQSTPNPPKHLLSPALAKTQSTPHLPKCLLSQGADTKLQSCALNCYQATGGRALLLLVARESTYGGIGLGRAGCSGFKVL
jgi:hypothetical protein